ncbi:MAG: pyrroline-5-carboxylate reductase [Myxococcales bacterium]|nr:pyrroline-5-carboxylate reductase [Myxococcales bacterium]
MSWTIGFVGAGVMAETMISGLLAEGFEPGRILASHRRADRVAELSALGVSATLDNRVAAAADVVVISVKPQTLLGVLAEVKGAVRPDALVVSIVAGARLRVLQVVLGHHKVVRCMPNLPCRIRRGMTVWCAAGELGDGDRARVAAVLGVMGKHIEVQDEGHVDRATAVNGTGPAIVAHFVKAFIEAAGYIGEPRGVARETVLETMLGTAEMILQNEGHIAELIDEVTSPGGTTSRALQVLKNGRFSAVLTESVDAAYQRTRELGDALEAALPPA